MTELKLNNGPFFSRKNLCLKSVEFFFTSFFLQKMTNFNNLQEFVIKLNFINHLKVNELSKKSIKEEKKWKSIIY